MAFQSPPLSTIPHHHFPGCPLHPPDSQHASAQTSLPRKDDDLVDGEEPPFSWSNLESMNLILKSLRAAKVPSETVL